MSECPPMCPPGAGAGGAAEREGRSDEPGAGEEGAAGAGPPEPPGCKQGSPGDGAPTGGRAGGQVPRRERSQRGGWTGRSGWA